MNYLVVGLHKWSRNAFTALEKLPGNWRFVSAPKELNEAMLADFAPRYVFFFHWSEKVPESIVKKYECIAFHMTELPYGRGGSPLQNLILRGHKQTKLSALRMTQEFDAGPLYGQEPLDLSGSAEEIYQRAMDLAVLMSREIVEKQPLPKPQEGPVSVFKRRKPEESLIPPLKDPEKLYDFIRMLDAEGYPHAFLIHEGFRFQFRGATLTDGKLRAEVEILPLSDGKESIQ